MVFDLVEEMTLALSPLQSSGLTGDIKFTEEGTFECEVAGGIRVMEEREFRLRVIDPEDLKLKFQGMAKFSTTIPSLAHIMAYAHCYTRPTSSVTFAALYLCRDSRCGLLLLMALLTAASSSPS